MRYKMDPLTWQKCIRRSWPFTIGLRTVIAFAMVLPLAIGLAPSFGTKTLINDLYFVKTFATTTAISTVAYVLSERLILVFKDTLCSKNMFGKDLNKLGEQATKEKV